MNFTNQYEKLKFERMNNMLSGGQMKHLRLLHNITQQALGKELGCSKNYISMMENNKQKCNKNFYDKYVKAIYKIYTKNENE